MIIIGPSNQIFNNVKSILELDRSLKCKLNAKSSRIGVRPYSELKSSFFEHDTEHLEDIIHVTQLSQVQVSRER
jgi:hypothetical protein